MRTGDYSVAVVVTDKLSAIDVRLTAQSDRAAGRTTVFVFPANDWEQPRDRFRFISRADPRTGLYRVGGLPPGDYVVAAIRDPAFDLHWTDPDVLQQLATVSKRISVSPGQRRVATVAVASLR